MAFPFKTIPGLSALYVTAVSFAAFAVTAGAPRNWAVSIPTATHSYGIRFRSGADAFFRPPVGWFIDHGFMVCVGLAITAAVLEIAARMLARRRDETEGVVGDG
ncbi:MAG: hypothetical protein QM736_01865 [Vicinamibacterales bacterium]